MSARGGQSTSREQRTACKGVLIALMTAIDTADDQDIAPLYDQLVKEVQHTAPFTVALAALELVDGVLKEFGRYSSQPRDEVLQRAALGAQGRDR